MKTDSNIPYKNSREGKPVGDLRRLAEKLLETKTEARATPYTEEDLQRLVHELQVHQIELELQNEELLRARKETEAGLQLYTELYDFAPVGYFTLDREGKIRRVNLTGATMLGKDRSLLIGRRFRDFVHTESHSHCNDFLHSMFEGMENITCEMEITITGSQPIVVHIKSNINNSGKECFIAVTDITAQKKAEEALRQANQKLNMLSSITRHDILNQIMAVRGYLEISKDLVDDPTLMDYIKTESEAVDTIQRQIEFTRYYQDIGVEEPKWQDAGEVIDAAGEQLTMTGITLENSLKGQEIFADPLLEKVFYNLMENSLRHGEHVTAISFSVSKTNDGLVISYRDNGVGITEEDKKSLFRKGFGKNTGLGLFLSSEILSITGITIRETGKPGMGVNFEIMVPEGGYRHIH